MSDIPSVEIIIPVYNGAKLLPRLISSLEGQTIYAQCTLRFLLTESRDDSKTFLNSRGFVFEKVERFDHAKTRESALLSSKADIAVFLTQDVFFKDPIALETLVKTVRGKVAISYLRQRGRGIGVERYVRHCNYPRKNETRDSTSIKVKGLKAFFCSDACMAYNVPLFKELNGFDGKTMPTNEDMYYARKALLSGNLVNYCADSYVIHSHSFSCKRTYRRYVDVAHFFKENPEFLTYDSNHAGMALALGVFWRVLFTINLYALLQFFPNMIARYLGMKHGRRH